MSTQSEQTLEINLINQLTNQGYNPVSIENETNLLANLKRQLEKHNKTFSRIQSSEKS
jgi:type I restriction enzyme R subunit